MTVLWRTSQWGPSQVTTSTDTAPAVRLSAVTRRFGPVTAVAGVDLDVAPGEFFAMLGPSGSGKTTCLRLIAGFEQPDEGHIEIFGQAVEGVPAYRRPVNTVFQDYALFPHMSVGENVAYGLKVRGIGRADREDAARQALELVKLGGMEGRKPSQLSGGQRQRVALARALVVKPKVMLLDEPLGALDLKLREEMQGELKSLQRQLGLTFIFVTHDQHEALGMSDRIAVFDRGRILQVGTPEDVYERPSSRFVADFVGSSNVLEPAFSAALGGPASWVSLRPERIGIAPAGASLAGPHATVMGIQYQGAMRRVELQLAQGRLVASVPASLMPLQEGMPVRVAVDPDAMHVIGDPS
jgi:putative spermidine/putrescine transport system ATP-binding protein